MTSTHTSKVQRGVGSVTGMNRLKELLNEVPPYWSTSRLKVTDIPRLFTTETFCKLVIRQQRAAAAVPKPR
jgi:acyl carrier protein